MKNSQQYLGNEANLATFSLSYDVRFLMVSPLLGRFFGVFYFTICNLRSAVCSLQMSYTVPGVSGEEEKDLVIPKLQVTQKIS